MNRKNSHMYSLVCKKVSIYLVYANRLKPVVSDVIDCL